MRLAINILVYYTVGDFDIGKALKSVKNFGAEFVDVAAYNILDPMQVDRNQLKQSMKMFKDSGLKCSQLLLTNTQHLASQDPSLRKRTLEYMKRCADVQLELGGKQVLICQGGGVYEHNTSKEIAWINSRDLINEYAAWCLDKGILISLEMDPHVYFLINNLEKMTKMIEDVEMSNLFANMDIGHLFLTREEPGRMEKLASKILHVHLSETDTFEHTNSILGTGKVNFRPYIDKLYELGIEANCERHNEVAIAAIEIGKPEDDYGDLPEERVRQSLEYIRNILPEISL